MDVVLSSDERFDVWQVKQAERPSLLNYEAENGDTCHNDFHDDGEHKDDNHQRMALEHQCNIESDDDNADCDPAKVSIEDDCSGEEESLPLPLIDGCDIPGWRRYKMIHISPCIQGVLNVGSGCTMLRRESQFPVVSKRACQGWHELQARLMREPEMTAIRLSSVETALLDVYPWFERENVPAILEGCCKDWKAMSNCTWSQLVQRFGHYRWRFSDTHGEMMTLSTYDKYVNSVEGRTDDAPLAVYDSQLDDDEDDERLAVFEQDYQVPRCFSAPDLFECLDNFLRDDDGCDNDSSPSRPPYRWILMGPERSGTGLHIDPLGTHAWVSLVQGLKRWVLFPYGTDQTEIGMQEPTIASAIWFRDYYQSCITKYPDAIEILQQPGETVYVPAGWPHIVLNLEASVAITQNYATEYPTMRRIVDAVAKEEPELLPVWLDALRQNRPDLLSKEDYTEDVIS